MTHLKKLEEIVLAVLRRNLVARSDDFILYGGTLKEMGFDLSTPIATALMYHEYYKLPSFESVTRVRRKIQEQRKDLVDYTKKTIRNKAQSDYKNYNRSDYADKNY